MTSIQQTCYRNKIAKHLLKAILFFSIFTLLGHVGTTTVPRQPQAVKTELVFADRPVPKRAIFYKTAPVLFYRKPTFVYFGKQEINNILLFHNRIAATKLAAILKQSYSFTRADRFVQLKNIPQIPSGEPSIANRS
jgi:hypothetical protein